VHGDTDIGYNTTESPPDVAKGSTLGRPDISRRWLAKAPEMLVMLCEHAAPCCCCEGTHQLCHATWMCNCQAHVSILTWTMPCTHAFLRCRHHSTPEKTLSSEHCRPALRPSQSLYQRHPSKEALIRCNTSWSHLAAIRRSFSTPRFQRVQGLEALQLTAPWRSSGSRDHKCAQTLVTHPRIEGASATVLLQSGRGPSSSQVHSSCHLCTARAQIKSTLSRLVVSSSCGRMWPDESSIKTDRRVCTAECFRGLRRCLLFVFLWEEKLQGVCRLRFKVRIHPLWDLQSGYRTSFRHRTVSVLDNVVVDKLLFGACMHLTSNCSLPQGPD